MIVWSGGVGSGNNKRVGVLGGSGWHVIPPRPAATTRPDTRPGRGRRCQRPTSLNAVAACRPAAPATSGLGCALRPLAAAAHGRHSRRRRPALPRNATSARPASSRSPAASASSLRTCITAASRRGPWSRSRPYVRTLCALTLAAYMVASTCMCVFDRFLGRQDLARVAQTGHLPHRPRRPRPRTL